MSPFCQELLAPQYTYSAQVLQTQLGEIAVIRPVRVQCGRCEVKGVNEHRVRSRPSSANNTQQTSFGALLFVVLLRSKQLQSPFFMGLDDAQ